ncbi:hypothetical protein [Castellaniella sp.]|uniref:hypothetical protein n=1 Tax=Castellaniella sp. TaxID=1955812 RepID=UPI002AFE52FE|nr:hypothetical protein [Castellaniella sp.]
MKFPKHLRTQLVADVRAVCAAQAKMLSEKQSADLQDRPFTAEMIAEIRKQSPFAFVHEINAQRSYDDKHPRWRSENYLPRVLEPSHVDGRCWLNELYDRDGYDLNDETLRTAVVWALRQVASGEGA